MNTVVGYIKGWNFFSVFLYCCAFFMSLKWLVDLFVSLRVLLSIPETFLLRRGQIECAHGSNHERTTTPSIVFDLRQRKPISSFNKHLAFNSPYTHP